MADDVAKEEPVRPEKPKGLRSYRTWAVLALLLLLAAAAYVPLRNLISQLSDERYPTAADYALLRRVAGQGQGRRLRFLESNLSSPDKAARLKNKTPYVMRAVVGFDRNTWSKAKQTLLEHGANPETRDKAMNIACASLALQLGEDDQLDAMVVANLLAAMQKTTKRMELAEIGLALGALGQRLPQDDAMVVVQRILAEIRTVKGSSRTLTLLDRELIAALGSLGHRVDAAQATAIAEQLLTLDNGVGFSGSSVYVLALANLVDRIPCDRIPPVCEAVVHSYSTTFSDPHEVSLRTWGGSTGPILQFCEALPDEHVASFTGPAMVVMNDRDCPRRIVRFAEILDGLGERLHSKDRLSAAERILTAMEQTSDDQSRAELGLVLRDVCKSLPSEQTTIVGRRIIVAMEDEIEPKSLHELGVVLDRLGKCELGEQAAGLATEIYARMERSTDAKDRERLRSVLVTLAKRMPVEQLRSLGEAILKGMEAAEDAETLVLYGETLGGYEDKLPEEHAARAGELIEGAIRESTEPAELQKLCRVLASMGDKLPTEQVSTVADRIIGLIEEESDARREGGLWWALESLGYHLPPHLSEARAKSAVRRMKDMTSMFALEGCASSLNSLGDSLPRDQAAVAIEHLIASIDSAEPGDYDYLRGALQNLHSRMSPKQVEAAAKKIVATLQETTDSSDFKRLKWALTTLGEKLPAEQAGEAVQLAIEMANSAEGTDRQMLLESLMCPGGWLPADQAFAAAQAIVSQIERGIGRRYPRYVLQDLVALMDVEDTIALLRVPICGGRVGGFILDAMGKKAGRDFEGDIWKMVDWAESQGIDVAHISL